MTVNYIPPITKVHSSFDEAKKFLEEGAGAFWHDEPDQALNVETLSQAKRSLIVGEPGVGKSLLLQRIQEHLNEKHVATCLVNLRRRTALVEIEEFLKGNTKGSGTLLLDALDEVKASDIPAMVARIEQLAVTHPDLQVFLSSRLVFIGRHAPQFPEFRFITISPFTRAQVRSYLIQAGRREADIDTLLTRIMSFGHQMLVIQVPRYLKYLDTFLKDKGLEAASKVSRNELFEYFIYSKLRLEDGKQDANTSPLTKRVLEKLALTMEIYQTNVITNDELMTFFDEAESDLKRIALAQVGIDIFYDYSVLKVSGEGLDKIEFDNAEFQEYLAAKEITRLPDPSRAAFSFAVDPQVNELYSTWYNTLTFLVDMEPPLLGQLVEFSGLRAEQFRVLDDNFFTFLCRIDPRRVTHDLRRNLFCDVVAYHERMSQWLPIQLAEALAAFYEPQLEVYLKERAQAAEPLAGIDRSVRLANVAYTVGCLLQAGSSLDRGYWRHALLNYASDHDENGVLQRHALFAIQCLKDATVLDDLPDFSDAEELVLREFLDTCKEVAPDHPRSLKAFLDAVRRREIHGRYGLYALKERASLRTLLETFVADEDFRREFMDGTSIFKEKDRVLVDAIESVLDDDIRELVEAVLVASLHYDISHDAQRSVFIKGLWSMLRKRSPSFVMDMVRRIQNQDERVTRLWVANTFFADVIEAEDVVPYASAMKDAGEAHSALRVMTAIKSSGRADADAIYEAGRAILKEEYDKWERAQATPKTDGTDEPPAVLQEFRTRLEPAPGKYMQNVFDFYNERAEELDPLLTKEDRARIDELLRNTVFKFMDPGQHGLEITQQDGGTKTYSVSSAVRIFGQALLAATRLGFDVEPYRKKVLSLIPFAYSDELKAILSVVKSVKPGEFGHVIEVYQSRHSDLWRHSPGSFVEAVEQYHVTEAAPVLKTFVLEPAWESYPRREALRVLDSIAPDPDFLRDVFERYKSSADSTEKELASIANGLLVTTHADRGAIEWRLHEVVERAAPFIQPKGPDAHIVSALEDEITAGKTFARPLMQLKHPDYERHYLAILDKAVTLWAKGSQFHQYAVYLWDIVYAYFDNLKERRSYKPLQAIEEAVAAMEGREGANWLANRIAGLRRSYLAYLGKPTTIGKAIARYNDARKYNDKEIRNSADLYRNLQDALDTDIRKWIEGEGAYDILRRKVAASGKQQYEKLVQMTLKDQIGYALLKRSFQVEVIREPQLLDDKRTDFLVRYGFAGPVVVEVKLTSNKDIQGKKIDESASFASMKRYMQGYGASHGIFMVLDNVGANNLAVVAEVFQRIGGVSVLTFDCNSGAQRKKPRRRSIKRRGTNTKKRRPRSRG